MSGYMCLLFLGCLAFCLQSVSADIETYNANGKVCNKCPPGTKVVADCSADFTNSTCGPCALFEYMDTFNGEKHCKACKSSCPKNGREVVECTSTTNRECLCSPGFHRYPVDPIDNHYECKAHTRCDDQPGYGEKWPGNHSHDVSCEKCVDGEQFVDETDPRHPRCTACSVCGPGVQLVTNCSLEADTVCSGNGTDGTQGESDGLTEEQIAGIVVGILIFIAAIIGIVIYCCRNQINVCCKHHCGKRTPSEKQVENGNTLTPLVQNWNTLFIERKVFPFLSENLGEEWRRFILQLPGWPVNTDPNVIIDHKREEEITVPNRIQGCLKEWQKKSDPHRVCKESIVATLRELGKEDLVDKLETLASEFCPSSVENGHH